MLNLIGKLHSLKQEVNLFMKFMSKPRRKLLYDYVLSFVFVIVSIALMLPFLSYKKAIGCSI